MGNVATSSSGVWGAIGRAKSGYINGWIYSPTQSVTPVVLIDGKPAKLVDWPLNRPLVARAFNTDAPIGFRFRADGLSAGSRIELFALSKGGLEAITARPNSRGTLSLNPLDQLQKAAEIARDPQAVAITCWDGGHNPIGRAKVLYDVASSRSPAVLFSYQFEEFGSNVWQPLVGADINLVVIPWAERDSYHRAMAELGLAFPTVWMCKPRFPTFLLASKVAHPEARLILDLDDNEEHFSMSLGSRRKIYGLPGLGSAKLLTQRVTARTVASISLQEEFGGHIVRHARRAVRRRNPMPGVDRPRALAFIGTVRPHKNLLAAARSLGVINWAQDRQVRLHVLGDVAPPELRSDLVKNGAVVGGVIPMTRLQERLRTMDCVLTGFPSSDPEEDAITRYQISSKIGDALAAGKPVLVPDGPSVRDLAGTPGVHLFNESNFAQQVGAALDSKDAISLPYEFSVKGAAESFESAFREASLSPRAREVFSSLLPIGGHDHHSPPQDTLLLIWKQHDAGLYGRRVDQVARAYKSANPESRVVVLELLNRADEEGYRERSRDFTADAGLILGLLEAKTGPGFQDQAGVLYNALRYTNPAALEKLIARYLVSSAMFPGNTRVILYPVIKDLDRFIHLFRSYRTVADFVDNQFAWSTTPDRRREYAWQYNVTARMAKATVFNSADNRRFFEDSGVIAVGDPGVHTIQNWYRLPVSQDEPASSEIPRRDPQTVVYTGNMNDRVDWSLVNALAEQSPDTTILLAGVAVRAGEQFEQLLARPNVAYLGPLKESDSLQVLRGAGVGIVPHVADNVSTFMNPLKVQMYAAAGLPTVAVDVPGLPEDGPLLRKTGASQFVETVQKLLATQDGSPPISSGLFADCESTPPRDDMVRFLSVLEMLDLE